MKVNTRYPNQKLIESIQPPKTYLVGFALATTSTGVWIEENRRGLWTEDWTSWVRQMCPTGNLSHSFIVALLTRLLCVYIMCDTISAENSSFYSTGAIFCLLPSWNTGRFLIDSRQRQSCSSYSKVHTLKCTPSTVAAAPAEINRELSSCSTQVISGAYLMVWAEWRVLGRSQTSY